MTASTRWRVWRLVGRLPDSTCDTVLIETFAARATSRMVTLPPGRSSRSASSRVTDFGRSVHEGVESSDCYLSGRRLTQRARPSCTRATHSHGMGRYPTLAVNYVA